MSGPQDYRLLGHDGMGSPLLPAPMTVHSPGHHTQSNMAYYREAYEPAVLNATRPQNKVRRRSSQSVVRTADIKHRRTRSGCFTCRSRRVKCDEARPVCERCRKGSRECIYPEPQISKSRQKQTAKAKCSNNPQSPTSSDEADEQSIDQQCLEGGLVNDDEDQIWHEVSWQGTAHSGSRRTSTASSLLDLPAGRQSSETPSQDGRSTSSSASVLTTGSWVPAGPQAQEAVHLPSDALDDSELASTSRHWLEFFADHVTHYHYGLVTDEDGFFKVTLPHMAVQCKPLMNAVMAFSAYHAALQDPFGRLEDFLHLYNKSVTQLLQIIDRKEMHSVHVLITILQLATIEEYLGDWVNLMGHQKAAFEIISQIYCPQTVTQTPIGRTCLNWYARFDNTVALMGGLPMEIPREWLLAMLQFHQNERGCQSIPQGVAERCARLQLILCDVSSSCARREKGALLRSDYGIEHERLSLQLQSWKDECDQALSSPIHVACDDPWTQMSTPDPKQLVPRWPLDQEGLGDLKILSNTILMAQWHSIMMMHRSQQPCAPHSHDALLAELSQNAYAVCQHFALLEQWPSAPAGTLIAVERCMSVAALVLSHSESDNTWLRGKFALIESLGHVFPISHRARMAEAFHDPDCLDWWLPNEEGLTPVLRYLRSFADERNAKPVTPQQEDLRAMRHFFRRFGLETAKA